MPTNPFISSASNGVQHSADQASVPKEAPNNNGNKFGFAKGGSVRI